MSHEEIKRAVIAAAVDVAGKRKLSCADALRIAADCGVLPKVIGDICDEEGIKLQTCQLGCF
ncbi:MAG: hypothetical protein WC956_05585 [bacterium]